MSERLKIQAIDPHVHLRDFDETHKEDIETGTRAAVTGGFTTVIDMPNNSPPIIDSDSLNTKIAEAGVRTWVYYGAYVGATNQNASEINASSQVAAGLKIYMNNTHGDMLTDNHEALVKHFTKWSGVILVHAEEAHLEAALNLARSHAARLHVCHVARRSEIEAIRDAKESGLPVTCEVTPHHLFLNEDDARVLGPLGYMKPELQRPQDVAALWQNLDVIDCLATDHAPHTLNEKHSDNPPPGIPGLETAMPLMLTAVAEGEIIYR